MKSHLNRRQFVCGTAATLAAGLCAPAWSFAQEPSGLLALETEHLRFSIGPDARCREFLDKRSGQNFCVVPNGPAIAWVKRAGQKIEATSVQAADGRLVVQFGDSGVQAVVQPAAHPHHIVLEVVSAESDGIEELALVDLPLTLRGTPEEPFAACALALNLQTNVVELPRPGSRLRAVCYPRFGLAGAKVALVAAPQDRLREALQEAVTAAEELPHSPIGGPWSIGPAVNRGSYLFNFGDMTVEKADAWIELARTLGMTQIDFHGGGSFRFGDCLPNPATYPEGLASLRAVIDKLHAAGIAAGLHTYAFFIDKRCPWVAPVPDPRLAKDATLTLAADLAADAAVVPTVESTAAMSTITGFFVRNSVTLQIDDELIVYTGVAKEPPFGFTGCQRGACGTQAAEHQAGAKVGHLKECFGLLVPDPETTLLAEVAAATASAFNTCGFDMIYLDALDGEDILGGAENGWHYGSLFTYEIWKRLQRPALMEMSTFHHHLWCVRSRFCAWDHPTRSHKRFVDMHVAANDDNRRMFMAGELGWWALKNWTGPQGEPTFSDDIEYLMAKCLGTDTGFALMGIDPDNVGSAPALPRLGQIIRRYEDLRHSGQVPEAIKARLRVPGDEFILSGSLAEGWQFRPANYDRHKVESAEAWSSRWTTVNSFAAQPLRLRIEALMAAGPYDAPGNPMLADFAATDPFTVRASAPGVSAELTSAADPARPGTVSGRLAARHGGPNRVGTWAQFEKVFAPPIDLSQFAGMGVWVYGDGQGELLNVQLRSPQHLSNGIGDHYIVVDFTGWRYFELIEPEGERHAGRGWPYGDIYSIYRESIYPQQVATLGVWCNDLPAGSPATCYLSPIRALPLVPGRLIRPSVTVNGRTVVFPVEISSGHYLEWLGEDDCKLYGPSGELVTEVKPEGEVPPLLSGANEVEFHAETSDGLSPRAHVTVMVQGDPIM